MGDENFKLTFQRFLKMNRLRRTQEELSFNIKNYCKHVCALRRNNQSASYEAIIATKIIDEMSIFDHFFLIILLTLSSQYSYYFCIAFRLMLRMKSFFEILKSVIKVVSSLKDIISKWQMCITYCKYAHFLLYSSGNISLNKCFFSKVTITYLLKLKALKIVEKVCALPALIKISRELTLTWW